MQTIDFRYFRFKYMNCMRLFLLLIFVLIFSRLSFSQKEIPQNYRKFDRRLLHFGFTLGVNTADFNVSPKIDAFEKYGVLSVENQRQPGGQVGLVAALKLGTPSLRLRLIPTLSFQERVLNYYYSDVSLSPNLEDFNEERINSTNFDLPLLLQFRTSRFNNFTSYVIGGPQYSLDFQSQQDAGQSYIDPFIKIRKHDFQGQVGVGVEFFMPYFKFGMEVKYSRSFGNVLIQDGTKVSNPIDRMNNQVWWFSLTFEG